MANSDNVEFIPALQKKIKELNYQDFTETQKAIFPRFLNGENLAVKTEYGSGKTAAFILPLLHFLKEHKEGGPRALIILPTKNLIYKVCKTLDTYLDVLDLNYGISHDRIKKSISDNEIHSCDILLSTADQLEKLQHADLTQQLEFLIVDEIDLINYFRYLPDLKYFIINCHEPIQKVIFYSFLNGYVEDFIKEICSDCSFLTIEDHDHGIHQISHNKLICKQPKDHVLEKLLMSQENRKVIVFTEYQQDFERISNLLIQNQQIFAKKIDYSQRKDYSRTIKEFIEGHIHVLVVNQFHPSQKYLRDASQIINFDCPLQADNYMAKCKVLTSKSKTYKEDAVINLISSRELMNLNALETSLNIQCKMHSLSDNELEEASFNNHDDVSFGRGLKDRKRR